MPFMTVIIHLLASVDRSAGEPATWIAAALACGYIIWHARERLASLISNLWRSAPMRNKVCAMMEANHTADSPVAAEISTIMFRAGIRELQNRGGSEARFGSVRGAAARSAEPSRSSNVAAGGRGSPSAPVEQSATRSAANLP